MHRSFYSLFLVLLLLCVGHSVAQEVSPSQRVIAIGDIHGDYNQLEKLLQSIGLIDENLAWIGGATHLVQLGDIPDRGPDTRKAMDLLIQMQTQALESGGEVTVLIGNHEAMMMTDDLRYVHPGEYAAFVDKNSKKRQKAYYKKTVQHLKNTLPKNERPKFDKAYRKDWEQRFPLGYVEHRLAWAPTGTYGKWVLSRPAVAKIGETLFVHGGLSPKYASMSLAEINTRIRTELAQTGNTPAELKLSEDEQGPLWNRQWATGIEDANNKSILSRLLSGYDASRMVVAHTPMAPIIVPRFDGKVLLADVGLSAVYGSGFAALEIVDDQAFMLLGEHRLEIPDQPQGLDAYFDKAEALLQDPTKLSQYREALEKQELKQKQVKSGP